MIDLWILAQQTAAWLSADPVVTAVSGGVAKAVGADLWHLLKSPFQAAGKAATLSDFEAEPTDPGNRAALEAALHKLLKADPAFAANLQQWLENHQPAASRTQTITQGDNSKAVANIGTGSHIEIH